LEYFAVIQNFYLLIYFKIFRGRY